MRTPSRYLFILCGLVLAAGGPFAEPAWAQERLLKSQLKDGSEVRAAFRQVVARVNQSTVAVLTKGRQVSLGVIVSADGDVMTKASELGEHLRCRLHDGREFPAQVAAVHDRYDVALLHIDAKNLVPVEWSDNREPQVGQWLATAGMEDVPAAVGIVSVQRRPIPPEKGVLGVQLSDAVPGPKVTHVVPSSAAARAGIQDGDLIIKAAEQAIRDPQAFEHLMRKLAPGDTVKLVVLRDRRELTMRATLGRPVSGQSGRGYWMNRMSGRMSQRRAGFPQAIQHDTVLDPEMCGGPVVDLSGKTIGLNIARAGRVETYAVPVDVARLLYRELRATATAARDETAPALRHERLERAPSKEAPLRESMRKAPTGH